MGKEMDDSRRRKYMTVSLPLELIEEIDQIIRAGHGYESRPEFIKDAIRRRLEELKRSPIPAEMLNEVRRITSAKRHGYTTEVEFIKDAVRRRLEELKRSPLEGG